MNNVLLPTPYPITYSTTTEFAHNDTVELFNSNKKRFGSTWHWYNNLVTYRFNSLGYRMNKELSEVDYDNYFAFFGCSFTAGTGIPVEATFSNLIAKRADVDYINAGVGGGTPELVVWNMTQLLTHAPKKPKVIMINWPEITRTAFWIDNKLQFMLPNRMGLDNNHWTKSYEAFIMEESHIENRFIMLRKLVQMLCNNAEIHLFEFSTFQSDDRFFDKYKNIHTAPIEHPDNDPIEKLHLNKGRDVSINMSAHPGYNHQILTCEKFFEIVKL